MGAKYDFGRNWEDEKVAVLVGTIIRSACIDHIKIEEKIEKLKKQPKSKKRDRELTTQKGLLYKCDLFFESRLYKLSCQLDKEDLISTIKRRLQKKVKGKKHSYGITNSLGGWK